MPDAYRCDLLSTTEELENFQPYWNALWTSDTQATPFQSPAWLLPWWRQFGQPGLRAVIVSRHSQPIAFLPFYICCEPPQRERRLLLVGAGTSDYLDGLYSPECTLEVVQAALECVLGTDGWDVLYAAQLRQTSLLYQAMRTLNPPGLNPPGMVPFAGDGCSRMPAVPIEGFPSKIRQNTRYYRNRARRAGDLALEFATEENWQAAFDAFVNLHTTQWQSKGQPGVMTDRRVLAFHREAIPLLLQQHMLNLCSLRLNHDTMAMGYSFVDPANRENRTQYIYLITHSERHAEFRPGTLLLASIAEHATENGVEWIDMLRGEESYKQLWHVEPVPTFGFAIREDSHARRLRCA